VGLDGDAVGTACAHPRQRVPRGGLVLVVVDRDRDALRRERERDAAPDPPRAARDQRVLPVDRHGDLPRSALVIHDFARLNRGVWGGLLGRLPVSRRVRTAVALARLAPGRRCRLTGHTPTPPRIAARSPGSRRRWDGY